jgi:hypothetical protein
MKPNDLFVNKNFITPHILEYGWIKKRLSLAYELSTGRSITGSTIFGVTVNNIEKSTSMSEVLYSKKEAEDYIDKLKKEFK